MTIDRYLEMLVDGLGELERDPDLDADVLARIRSRLAELQASAAAPDGAPDLTGWRAA